MNEQVSTVLAAIFVFGSMALVIYLYLFPWHIARRRNHYAKNWILLLCVFAPPFAFIPYFIAVWWAIQGSARLERNEPRF